MEDLFIPVKPEKSYPWYLRFVFLLQKKRFGEVLIPTLLWSRVPSLSLAFLLFYFLFQRKKSFLSPELQSLVMVRVAQVHECAFCIDLNALFLTERAQHHAKLQEVANWNSSSVFSEKEKLALEFAEAMTQTECKVSDELRGKLKSHFSDESLLELTALIAFQNLSARFNSALKLPSQGLCKI
ncbi:carboxymuconolactone decarboxylase family protein [bacterium]|nr:carboxymuconolactone decarboxylase family protein [bacterium]NBX83094.1 carboxymuconolactone decarboxylase family protein [bacterium]